VTLKQMVARDTIGPAQLLAVTLVAVRTAESASGQPCSEVLRLEVRCCLQVDVHAGACAAAGLVYLCARMLHIVLWDHS